MAITNYAEMDMKATVLLGKALRESLLEIKQIAEVNGIPIEPITELQDTITFVSNTPENSIKLTEEFNRIYETKLKDMGLV